MKYLRIFFAFAFISLLASCSSDTANSDLPTEDVTTEERANCADRFISQMYVVITGINNYPQGGSLAITSAWVNTLNVINDCTGNIIGNFPDPENPDYRDGCDDVGGGGNCQDGSAVLNALTLFQCRLYEFLDDPETAPNAQNLQTALCDYLTMVNACFGIGIDVEFHCQDLLDITP